MVMSIPEPVVAEPTLQEAYDTIVDWFEQPEHDRSVDDKGICVYRGPNGNRCAVGVLLPDEEYDPKMEGSMIAREVCVVLGWESEALREFLAGAQTAHDFAPNKEIFLVKLHKLAESFGIEV